MDEFTDCFICGRYALVGEEVTVISGGERETNVCDLCLTNPRATGLGEPIRRERISTLEGAATVRRLIPVPVASPASPSQPKLPLKA
jgi:hypothetical protein